MRESYRITSAMVEELIKALPEGEVRTRFVTLVEDQKCDAEGASVEERCAILEYLEAKRFNVDDIAVKMGLSTVAIYLLRDIKRLDEVTRREVFLGRVAMDVGRYLGRIKSLEARHRALKEVMDAEMNSKAADAYIRESYIVPQKANAVMPRGASEMIGL